ncbi:MAG: U-box domain-containing protein [Gammaproteobacteria bacterium]
MFASFFAPAEPKDPPILTRIQKLDELKQVLEQIGKLQQKETELEASSKELGVSSVDYAKYSVVSMLLLKLKEKINAFNENKLHRLPVALSPLTPKQIGDKKPTPFSDRKESVPPAVNEVKEQKTDKLPDGSTSNSTLVEIILLSREMSMILKEFYSGYSDTLNTLRKPGLFSAQKSAVQVASFGAIGAAAAALSFSTMGTGAALLLAGPHLSNKTLELSGLAKPMTTTSMLITTLIEMLEKTADNLELVLNLKAIKKSSLDTTHPEPFVCLITKELMKDPVICKLDGKTYERKAITEWLNKERTSPWNRTKMADEDTVEKVLTDNINLRHLLENYRQQQLLAETQLALTPSGQRPAPA